MSQPFRSCTLTADLDGTGLMFKAGNPLTPDFHLFGKGTPRQFPTTAINRACSVNWQSALGDAKAIGTYEVECSPGSSPYGGTTIPNLIGSWDINWSGGTWDDTIIETSLDTPPNFTDGALVLKMWGEDNSFDYTFLIDFGNRTYNPGGGGALVCNHTALVTLTAQPPLFRLTQTDAPTDYEIDPDPPHDIISTGVEEGLNYWAETWLKIECVLQRPTVVSNDTGYDVGDGSEEGDYSLKILLGDHIPGGGPGDVSIAAGETGFLYTYPTGGYYDSRWAFDQRAGCLTISYNTPQAPTDFFLVWHDFVLMRLNPPDPAFFPLSPGLVVTDFAFGPRTRYGARADI